MERVLVKTQDENNMMLAKIQQESISKMESFQESFEKELQFRKEKEDLMREKDMVMQKYKLLRKHLSEISGGANTLRYPISLTLVRLTKATFKKNPPEQTKCKVTMTALT